MNTELNAIAVLALLGNLFEQIALRDERIRALQQQLAEQADTEGDE